MKLKINVHSEGWFYSDPVAAFCRTSCLALLGWLAVGCAFAFFAFGLTWGKMRALDSDETATEPSPGLPHPAAVNEPTSNRLKNVNRDDRLRLLLEAIMGMPTS